MLRASSISLLIASGFTFSTCLTAANAGPQQLPALVILAQKAKPDAKKESKPAAKEASKDAKGADAKKDAKDKDKKEAVKGKDDKDDKDDKTAGDGKNDKADAKDETPEKEPVITNVNNVKPEDLIENPKEYLGKNIRFTADFSGFCTLALNYKPALRPQKTHISFLVRKAESKIPLSEIKLALPIPKETDKVKNKMLTSLKDGDKIEVTGKVFSTALDDPWIDVLAIKRLEEAKKPEGEESEEDAGE